MEMPTAPDDPGAQQRWYRLDARNVVLAVDPYWDQFALANGGESACSARVIGRPLRDFIQGDTCHMFIDALIEAARLTGRPRRVPYRCDAPAVVRQFELVITPMDEGELLFEHRLLYSRPYHEPRPAALLPVRRPSLAGHAHALRCSQCLKMAVPASGVGWTRANMLPDLGTQISYTVCPGCLSAAHMSPMRSRGQSDSGVAAADQYPGAL